MGQLERTSRPQDRSCRSFVRQARISDNWSRLQDTVKAPCGSCGLALRNSAAIWSAGRLCSAFVASMAALIGVMLQLNTGSPSPDRHEH